MLGYLKKRIKENTDKRIGLLMSNYDLYSFNNPNDINHRRLCNIEKLLALLLHDDLVDLKDKNWLTVEEVKEYEKVLRKILE